MKPTPSAASRRMTSNSFSSSAPPSAAEGSSSTTMRALRDSAPAISTICRCATLRFIEPRAGIDAKAEPLHRPRRLSPRSRRQSTIPNRAARQAAEKDVLGDRQMRRLHQFLVDDRDAELDHPERRRVGDRLAGDADLARIRPSPRPDRIFISVDFAGAVLADQRRASRLPAREKSTPASATRRETTLAMPLISRRGGVGRSGSAPVVHGLGLNAYDLII